MSPAVIRQWAGSMPGLAHRVTSTVEIVGNGVREIMGCGWKEQITWNLGAIENF